MSEDQPKFAVLLPGTRREVAFILRILPHLAGQVDYDVFVVLRHVQRNETSRLGSPEEDFKLANIAANIDNRIFLCELPPFETEQIERDFLTPVGPTNVERERGVLSMYHGVFAAIAMMKSSLRRYTHVMKTRTDYLPWAAPWLPGMLGLREKSGGKIIIDGHFTQSWLYPDRHDLHWHGSISDAFCFASLEQFLRLWDIQALLPSVWTGVAETTLFRAAMLRFLGDSVQSPRRNETFLNKIFTWDPNDSKKSFYLLRAGVLTEPIKKKFLELAGRGNVAPIVLNELLRRAYDFVVGEAGVEPLRLVAGRCLSAAEAEEFVLACQQGAVTSMPV